MSLALRLNAAVFPKMQIDVFFARVEIMSLILKGNINAFQPAVVICFGKHIDGLEI